MRETLFQTFRSPYHASSLESPRYRRLVPYLAFIIVFLPVIFLIFKSFTIYLISHVLVFFLFPGFLWVYLMTEKLSDIKLDVIKVFVIITLYLSYLAGLVWVMIVFFNPSLKTEFIFLSLGYMALLLLTTIMVTGVFFYHRYAQRIIKRKTS